jgi:molecular chaperone DnaJ
MAKDYYEILGVPKDASKEDIKKAFRKLAHEHHPDKKTGNEAKFKEANEAYSVLSDDAKRKQYDMYGSGFSGGQGGGAGFNQNGFGGFDFSGFAQGAQGGVEFDLGDIFGDFFGGGRSQRQNRGQDISTDIELTFEESIFGVDRTISLNKISQCTTCKGDGAKPGTELTTCATCNGKGTIREVRQSIIGSFASNRVCDVCHGRGKIPKEKCETCRGRGTLKRESEIKVHIPEGIEDGEVLRLPGQGEAIAGGTTGDLYIKIHVRDHKIFQREGANLVMDLKIKLTDALLGAQYGVETLDGAITVKIPEGVSFGEVLRIKGKGVPYGIEQIVRQKMSIE